MIKAKVCGITKLEDALNASVFGYDAIGFIFYEKSKRFIMPEEATRIIRKLPPFISTVGVFVDASLYTINKIKSITGITTIQLHGNESPDFCNSVSGKKIKAFRVNENFKTSTISQYKDSVNAFLLDAWDEKLKGGTGKPVDWKFVANMNSLGNMILAGGLGPTNIKEAIDIVNPYSVDVNSGVEIKPGEKNTSKLKEVIDIVKSY